MRQSRAGPAHRAGRGAQRRRGERGSAMTPLLLAVALSLDGLGAGIAYGLQRIRVPFLALVVVAGTSAALFFLTLTGAGVAVEALAPVWSRILGALILVGIGLWHLLGEVCRLGSLAVVVRILADPTAADLDRSGQLSLGEAALLGLALALDAAAAGVGAGLSGLGRPWLPALVGGVTFLFTAAGLRLGRAWADWGKAAPVLGRLPGCLLIALGLHRLFWRG
ncbi:MAG: manganese efflux pump [Bacillota bacterium]|nr:manganese efflux pump [Bacillota bacterium]